MAKMRRWHLHLVVALVCPVALASAKASPTDPPQTQTVSGKDSSRKSAVDVIYDENKDESNVGFTDLQIYSHAHVSITLNLGCSYEGRIPSDPGQCFVSLTSRSASQQYP